MRPTTRPPNLSWLNIMNGQRVAAFKPLFDESQRFFGFGFFGGAFASEFGSIHMSKTQNGFLIEIEPKAVPI